MKLRIVKLVNGRHTATPFSLAPALSPDHNMLLADGQVPKDLPYGELMQGNHPRGKPQLQYKDICKWDLKALEMDLNRWETLTSEHSAWRQAVHHGLSQFEETLA